MKKHVILLACIIISQAGHSQNPFAKYGYQPRMHTLSNGKYPEFFDTEDVVRIGTSLFNTQTNKIVGYVEDDTSLYAQLEADLASRWLSLDPLAEKDYGWSPYKFCYNNPLIFIDPDGRGEYYNEKGKRIGGDGVNDNNAYIVMNRQEAKAVAKTDKGGGTTARNTLNSTVGKPSQDVMNSANTAVQNTDATGNEHGFVAATDGTTSSVVTDNSPSDVKLGPAYQEVEGNGKQTSFDVHTHPNKVTMSPDGKSFVADDPNPSGTPGQPGADYGYRGMKESQGKTTEPSWVIGTSTTATNNNGTISTNQTKVVTFYTSQGVVGQMSWTQFQKLVNSIP